MHGHDFRVPMRTWDSIQNTAYALRRSIGLENRAWFPIMSLLDAYDKDPAAEFSLRAGDDSTMNGAEGYTDPFGAYIELHEDVMHDAWENDGRARFTAAHELGHLLLHTNIPVRLTRLSQPQLVAPHARAEPQANFFAACLLMPHYLIGEHDTERTMKKRFGVTYTAASIRLKHLGEKAQKKRRGQMY
jgi:Zn-dependent peptidase ImmA (M78 family)